ncbi:MAG: hypothetical protein ABI769_18050 [Pseudomonadota bacterium]
MHFTYRDPAATGADAVEANVLNQGDLLKRTPELEAVLNTYYPGFGNNAENKFFLVITQSCDLVPRSGGVCKAKYIQIVAVRPLRFAIEREIADMAESGFNLKIPVASQKNRNKLDQFLERLLNNNESEYFYLHQDASQGLAEDCCACLTLSVTIKAEHYATCLAARILSLDNLFQAKLGWMVGQMYARVGTDDWPHAELSKQKAKVSKDAAMWVDDKALSAARTSVAEWRAANPGVILDTKQFEKMVEKLPTKQSLAMGRLKEVLEKSQTLGKLQATPQDLERVLKGINGDQQFQTFLK